MFTSSALAVAPALAPTVPAARPSSAEALLQAGRALSSHLEAGRSVDAPTLRAAMVEAFDASDAEGAWSWKDAYEACEVAQLLFLRRFGPAIRAKPAAAQLAILSKIAALLPTHTRRSEESQAFQQFSTPTTLGFVASVAAGITPTDLVLEPSAGTGLLAVFAELAGASLVLNEFADTRAGLLDQLFPSSPVTRYDAAHIHDLLDGEVRPSIVLMNPPFTPGLSGACRAGVVPAPEQEPERCRRTSASPKVNDRVRFGRSAGERIIDRRCRIALFAPDSLFGYVQWRANRFGTELWRLWVLRAGAPGERLETLPGVMPGAHILVSLAGAARVTRALELIDAIEAQGLDPADVPESYWRTAQNRLSAGLPCRVYGAGEHAVLADRAGVRP